MSLPHVTASSTLQQSRIEVEACAELEPTEEHNLGYLPKRLNKTYTGIYFFLTNALHPTLTFKQGINHKD
jgi:hypothetical protein